MASGVGRACVLVTALVLTLTMVVTPTVAADPTPTDNFTPPAETGPNELLPDEDMGVPPVFPRSVEPFRPMRVPSVTPATAASINPIGFSFHTDAFDLRELAVNERPFYSETRISLVDTSPHDATGVRMYLLNGVLYDHPVAQAQYALMLLNNYRMNGDPAYLARAELQAQRLIDRRVVSRNAWYYPYPFDADSGADFLKAPWYSAMAQGLALAVFVWLSEMTDESIYPQAATMTFNSFANNRVSGAPWTVWVDSGGYLWLEEYPRAVPDQTINGSITAAFGLVEYFRYTGVPEAKRLAQGAFTTIRHYLPTIRTGWISYYCLSHRNRNAYYHLVVTGQLQKLYTITGSPDLSDWAELFVDDWPDYRYGGTVRFTAGTHTGYQFDTNGSIIGQKSFTLSATSTAPMSSRQTIQNRSGVWFQVSGGVFAGYWIREIPGKSYVAGKLPQVVRYNPARSIWLSPGSYTAYQFATDGSVIASRKLTPAELLEVHASQLAVINGRGYRNIIDGPLAGFWLATGAGSSRVAVNRIGGADRFATAAGISAGSFAPGVAVAYLATGVAFPDALVGGAAAAHTKGPILLTRGDELPAATIDELTRLKPAAIVILGGPGAIDETVADAARGLAPKVSRLAGADRYATAAAVSAATFEPGVRTVYLATGLDFPDALAGAAAAGKAGGPVLLSKPGAIPAATIAELKRLRPSRITVLGGPGVLSDGVLSAARAYAPAVNRVFGSDRYATAVAVSRSAFRAGRTPRAFMALGTAFPDGLAASAVAGRDGASVLLVPPSALPASVAAELQRMGPPEVTVLSRTAIRDAVVVAIRNVWP